MRVTLKDIAQELKISEAAVSMALNDKPGVSNETRKMIKKMAQDRGYQPNKFARSLVVRQSDTLGLIVPDIENPYYSRMVACVSQYARELGYGLELATSNEDISLEKQIVKDFISKQVEGIIISPINKLPANLSHYEYILKRKLPAVFIASKYPGIPLPSVLVDLKKGSYHLVNYLFGEGRQRIKFLSGPIEIYAFSERIQGCRQAYLDCCRKWEEQDVIVCSRVDFEQAYFATLNILQSKEEVDTIVTSNDYMALGVLKALYEKGVKVPNDIAVAGYDDIIYASISNISITTVSQNIELLSRLAVDQVLNSQIQDIGRPSTTFVEPGLVVRASTMSKR